MSTQVQSLSVRELLKDPVYRWVLLPPILFLGILYTRLIDLPNLEMRRQLHYAICAGTAESPYRYRVLVPYGCDALIQLFTQWMPYDVAFVAVYGAYNILALTLSFSVLYYWLRWWHPRLYAVLGTLFACATVPVAFWDHYFQPWSLLEPALLTVGLMLVLRRKHGALAALLVVYTLLRETALVLALAYGLTYWHSHERSRETLFWGALYGVLWGAVYISLRLGLANAPHAHSIAELIGLNFSSDNLLKLLGYGFLMFGGFVVYAKWGWREAPETLRRVSCVMLPYIALMAVWAIWKEMRCWVPLYPILLALGLYSVRRLTQSEGAEQTCVG